MTARNLKSQFPYGLGMLAVYSLAWFALQNTPALWVSQVIMSLAITAAVGLTMAWGMALRNAERKHIAGYFRSLSERRPEEWSAASPPVFLSYGMCGEFHAEFLTRVAEAIENWETVNQQRAKAELKAKRSAEECQRLSEIIAGLDDPVLAINSYEEVQLANRAAEKLFGIHFDPKTKQRLNELPALASLAEQLRAAQRHRSSVHRTSELALVDPDGCERTYRLMCRNSDRQNEHAAAGAIAVLTDVSDRKLLQKRHAEFVSSVSHEMKTPLASIKAYVELLADGDAEDEATQEEFLGVINGQADRLQRLIDNLLNIARIEAGVVHVNKRTESLNELLDEAFGVVQPSAEPKKITLQAELSPLYLGALADRDMLLQSAINLLSNAIKYTPDGGKVTLRSRLTDAGVEFEVEDTGVGLSEEDRVRIFDKFYRVSKDRKMASGTGLGLALAKHIVEEVHGGSLTVLSELGKGSTFRITLPPVGTIGA